MMHTLFILILMLAAIFSSGAQSKIAKKYAKTITTEDLYTHVSILAADSLEGRETGKPGQKKAANYIADFLEQIDLNPYSLEDGHPSYFQKFYLEKSEYHTVYFRKGEIKKINFEDFLFYSNNETFGEEIIEVIFAGYADSIDNIDFTNKYVAFINREGSDFRATLAKLKTGKAKGYVLIIEDELQFEFVMDRYSNYLNTARMSFDTDKGGSKIVLAGKDMAEWIFGKSLTTLMQSKESEISEIIFNADMHTEEVQSENVIGYIKGSAKPSEVVVVSAHYDHLGIINGEIYNGADDDASGTSTMLELAEAFSLAAKDGYTPKRSILFLANSGEEKGLLGSNYYVRNPLFPLSHTIVNLNIDMVGRVDEKHSKNPNYVYLIGSDKLSQDLHNLSEGVNRKSTKLELDYTYNAENDPNRYYYRSDHYNFAKNGIPVIFYFNGTHGDYHQPTDTVEKIKFDKMKKIADLIFLTAWEIANREERLSVEK